MSPGVQISLTPPVKQKGAKMKKIILSTLCIVMVTFSANALTRGTAEYKAFEKVFYEECMEDGKTPAKACRCMTRCIADKIDNYTSDAEAYEIGFRCGLKCVD